MICVLAKVPVTLTIAGPLLTAGSTHAAWGVDVTFYRDWQGHLALPGSHVKGKLREAMADLHALLKTIGHPAGSWSVDEWFGRPSEENAGNFEPDRGRIKITDFRLVEETTARTGATRTRIRVDDERRTVEEGALLVYEAPFPSGRDIRWLGSVEFFAAEDQVDGLVDQLRGAFCFITTIGAEKSIGWGRLKRALLGQSALSRIEKAIANVGAPHTIDVAIQPAEPLLVGGVRRIDNIFSSEAIISGAVVKGAYAVGLNRLTGNPKTNTAIDEKNTYVAKECPELARYFSDLLFQHAVPDTEPHRRLEAPPLSLFTHGDTCLDAAFMDREEDICSQGSLPAAFCVDWKGPPKMVREKYLCPDLTYHTVTRTAIDTEMRKADDSQLYSFQALKPRICENGQYRQLLWNTMIRFPKAIEGDTEARKKLAAQIRQTLPLALSYLGKRQSRVSVQCRQQAGTAAPDRTAAGRFAVVLQTPAVILNPADLVSEDVVYDDAAKLLALYTDFWADERLMGANTKLLQHFSALDLTGGVLGMRHMSKHYRPFLLTRAGSTFVFQASSDIEKRLQPLLDYGLPLPAWAMDPGMYGATETWRRCPYVPENGFGEIKISAP